VPEADGAPLVAFPGAPPSPLGAFGAPPPEQARSVQATEANGVRIRPKAIAE